MGLLRVRTGFGHAAGLYRGGAFQCGGRRALLPADMLHPLPVFLMLGHGRAALTLGRARVWEERAALIALHLAGSIPDAGCSKVHSFSIGFHTAAHGTSQSVLGAAAGGLGRAPGVWVGVSRPVPSRGCARDLATIGPALSRPAGQFGLDRDPTLVGPHVRGG